MRHASPWRMDVSTALLGLDPSVAAGDVRAATDAAAPTDFAHTLSRATAAQPKPKAFPTKAAAGQNAARGGAVPEQTASAAVKPRTHGERKAAERKRSESQTDERRAAGADGRNLPVDGKISPPTPPAAGATSASAAQHAQASCSVGNPPAALAKSAGAVTSSVIAGEGAPAASGAQVVPVAGQSILGGTGGMGNAQAGGGPPVLVGPATPSAAAGSSSPKDANGLSALGSVISATDATAMSDAAAGTDAPATTAKLDATGAATVAAACTSTRNNTPTTSELAGVLAGRAAALQRLQSATTDKPVAAAAQAGKPGVGLTDSAVVGQILTGTASSVMQDVSTSPAAGLNLLAGTDGAPGAATAPGADASAAKDAVSATTMRAAVTQTDSAATAAYIPAPSLDEAAAVTSLAMKPSISHDTETVTAKAVVDLATSADAASSTPGAGFGLASLSAHSTAQNAAPAAVHVRASIDSADFAQTLADKVAWLVDKDIGSAKLSINPPQLGPVDVHVEVSGDKAQVVLSTHSLVTRDALEAASPRLREVLGSNGFTQVSVDVSHRSFQDRTPPSRQWSAAALAQRTDVPAVSEVARARTVLGTLDAYA